MQDGPPRCEYEPIPRTIELQHVLSISAQLLDPTIFDIDVEQVPPGIIVVTEPQERNVLAVYRPPGLDDRVLVRSRYALRERPRLEAPLTRRTSRDTRRTVATEQPYRRLYLVGLQHTALCNDEEMPAIWRIVHFLLHLECIADKICLFDRVANRHGARPLRLRCGRIET